MRLLRLMFALMAIICFATMLYGQDALVAFRTGEVEGPWCPILGPDMLPLPYGAYVGIYLAGGNGVPDPPGIMGEPTGDDIQPTGNNIDHLIIHPDEPPSVPPGNLFSANPALIMPPAGTGVEPLVNQGDAMYLRAFNSYNPSTATHCNDILEINGGFGLTYTATAPGPAVVTVCFSEAYEISPM